jgi:hypothetical protein
MINIIGSKAHLLKQIEDEHRAKYFDSIESKLTDLSERTNSKFCKKYYLLLKENLNDILIGRPDRLNELKEEIVEFEETAPKMWFDFFWLRFLKTPKLLSIFDYSDFSGQYKIIEWGAYKFTRLLDVNTCLYCNRSYIFTIVVEPDGYNLSSTDEYHRAKRARPQLDHFYSQNQHPYFALSIYNLIPCCSICNTSFKNTEEFTIESHINPFHESFHDFLRFTVRFKKSAELDDLLTKGKISPKDRLMMYVDFFSENEDSFDVKVAPQKGKEMSEGYSRAFANSKSFALEPLYNMHKDYVSEMVLKCMEYNDSHFSDISEIYGLDEKDLEKRNRKLRYFLGNYATEADIPKRPLSKITIDIAKEFKLPIS